MYWEPILLQPPCHHESSENTIWLPGGKQYYEDHRGDEPLPELIPGTHYAVNDAILRNKVRFVLFPDESALHIFRHEWVLRRRSRPMTPSPERTPLPHARHSSEQRARIFSVYMRPWALSLLQVSRSVPHLRWLDRMPTDPLPEHVRLVGKAPELCRCKHMLLQ